MDFMDDALFSEALDDFELTAFPFVPSCYISSGFCPTGPTFSTTPTLAPTCSSSLVSSSASGSTAPAPLLASSTRYAPPKTEREIQDAIQSTVPQKTRDDTKYCCDVMEGVRMHILCHRFLRTSRRQTSSSSSSDFSICHMDISFLLLHLLPPVVKRSIHRIPCSKYFAPNISCFTSQQA